MEPNTARLNLLQRHSAVENGVRAIFDCEGEQSVHGIQVRAAFRCTR
jgi:hypothetical protein